MTVENLPKAAFVYPGQGSIEAGKILRITSLFDVAKKKFDVGTEYASERLGVDLGKLMIEGGTIVLGDEEVEINDTRVAQPATLIESVVGSAALKQLIGRDPNFRSYHSFGLIAALHDDGVYKLTTAVELAIERGNLMHQDSLEKPGAMAAFFGTTEERILALCAKHGISFATDNSHTEKVVSGEEENVKAAINDETEEAEKSGGKKPIMLKVPIGAHSPLVERAGMALSKKVEELRQGRRIRVPRKLAVYSSRSQNALRSFEDIKADIAGLPDRVHWRNTILGLVDQGYIEIYETGPGSKLSRLPRKDPIMKKHLEDRGAFIVSLDQLLDRAEA